MRRNLARTMQPARPVLQTEITNVCVFPDLLVMIVKTVGNTLTKFSKNSLGSLSREETGEVGERGGGELKHG